MLYYFNKACYLTLQNGLAKWCKSSYFNDDADTKNLRVWRKFCYSETKEETSIALTSWNEPSRKTGYEWNPNFTDGEFGLSEEKEYLRTKRPGFELGCSWL